MYAFVTQSIYGPMDPTVDSNQKSGQKTTWDGAKTRRKSFDQLPFPQLVFSQDFWTINSTHKIHVLYIYLHLP